MTPYYQDEWVTIYHGDSRQLLPVVAPIQSDPPYTPVGVMVTDPPYGMAHRSGMDGAFGDCAVQGDDTTAVRDLILDLWADRPALVFGRWSVPRPARTRMVLTWDKGDALGMGALDLPWKPSTEEIYVLGKGFTGTRNVGAVLRWQGIGPYQQARGERFHPTQKPVELLHALIERCPPGVVVDPFLGSGSTLRAAKDLGRRAIGIEIEERYCEIAAGRCAQEVLDLGATA